MLPATSKLSPYVQGFGEWRGGRKARRGAQALQCLNSPCWLWICGQSPREFVFSSAPKQTFLGGKQQRASLRQAEQQGKGAALSSQTLNIPILFQERIGPALSRALGWRRRATVCLMLWRMPILVTNRPQPASHKNKCDVLDWACSQAVAVLKGRWRCA